MDRLTYSLTLLIKLIHILIGGILGLGEWAFARQLYCLPKSMIIFRSEQYKLIPYPWGPLSFPTSMTNKTFTRYWHSLSLLLSISLIYFKYWHHINVEYRDSFTKMKNREIFHHVFAFFLKQYKTSTLFY